nr:MAG TPA: hypothetical protein [Caudoviricetes sp.]
MPACDCTKGPRNWNTDYRDRYRHRHDTSHREQERTHTTRVRRAKGVVNLVRINSELRYFLSAVRLPRRTSTLKPLNYESI